MLALSGHRFPFFTYQVAIVVYIRASGSGAGSDVFEARAYSGIALARWNLHQRNGLVFEVIHHPDGLRQKVPILIKGVVQRVEQAHIGPVRIQ